MLFLVIMLISFHKARCGVAISFLCMTTAVVAKPIELFLWHGFVWPVAKVLTDMTDEFNRQQNRYVVTPVYKGEYSDVLTAFAAAFRAKAPPAMVQIFEVGTSTMLRPYGIVKPLSVLMQEAHYAWSDEDTLPAVKAYYSRQGEWQALPFNTSIPIVYYNADSLGKLGITEDNFPKTWSAFGKLLHQLKKAGYPCGYTTAYPAWIHVESYLAIHGLALLDEAGAHPHYAYKALGHHLQRLRKWQSERLFEYGGRTNESTALFTSRRCQIFTQSSGSYTSLTAVAPFKVGVASLPMDIKVSPKRYNNVIGGAGLWVAAGQSKEQEAGIAAFLHYFSAPRVQHTWYLKTGYFPLQRKALKMASGDPLRRIIQAENATLPSPARTFSEIPQQAIRQLNDEALESIFAGLSSADVALRGAVQQADLRLKQYRQNRGISVYKEIMSS